jgi:hypothetical protein
VAVCPLPCRDFLVGFEMPVGLRPGKHFLFGCSPSSLPPTAAPIDCSPHFAVVAAVTVVAVALPSPDQVLDSLSLST